MNKVLFKLNNTIFIIFVGIDLKMNAWKYLLDYFNLFLSFMTIHEMKNTCKDGFVGDNCEIGIYIFIYINYKESI
jgi:hypothetical protein